MQKIKSIRLQNFKGFKDTTLNLKPLTVLLGPNSSGKSCFGQALVALSKSNAKNETPSLAFNQKSAVEFGRYSELVHQGCEGQPVIIELFIESDSGPATITMSFGPEDKKNLVKDLELISMEIQKHNRITISSIEPSPVSVAQVIETQKLIRGIYTEWTIAEEGKGTKSLNVGWNGWTIANMGSNTPNMPPVEIDKVIDSKKLALLSSLLRGISYLRPDREPPLRKKAIPFGDVPNIDDRGVGTDWYIHRNRDLPVETLFFPDREINTENSIVMLKDYLTLEKEKKPLPDALALWLKTLGLASYFEVNLFDEEHATQSLAKLLGQDKPRPLTDLGFGLSQVIPILVKGLTLQKEDLLVVEQPEAQLHPKPQAGLADFFCAMVKCDRNVIVETHSEELFHRLRLRAAMDDDLAEKIGVYFLHEPVNGVCSDPVPITLSEEAELKWPKGFLPDGMRSEMAIRALRRARLQGSYNADSSSS